MTTALLTTKLYIPPVRPELVSRRHLIERLNAGLSGKLTLVSAPAGFGKTTLISEWISQSDIPFCWVSLDENDNDPGRFLAYLTASLQSIEIDVDLESIKLLQNPEQGQIETVLTGTINQIADAQKQFAVVLDDYHHIQNQEVQQILSYLLDHLPPQVHLVIGTRADPHLPIARLRARGELTELRSADLRFSLSEGGEFLYQNYGLEIQAEDVEKLVSRTDGWVAGLQLASIALRGRPDQSEFIQHFSGSHDYIVDFLTTEVLEKQAEDIQVFLLKTAVLKRLSAPLCEVITDQENSQQVLKELRINNIFLSALDDENQWFAYHQLFRDLLTQQLFEKYPEDVPDLYLKAAIWCEAHGFINDAVDYALQGHHLERAADLIESQAQTTIQQSEITTFIRWVERLPEDLVHTRPDLCIFYAWALLVSHQKPEIADRCLNQVSAEDIVTRGKLNAIRAIQAASQRRVPEAVKLARQALDQLPDDEYFFRQITGWNLSAVLFLSGEADESVGVLEDVAMVSLASGNRMVAVVALCRLGNIQLQQGDLYSANDYYRRALSIASENRKEPMPVACEALIGLGKIQWEWYQFDNAQQLLLDGLALSKLWREVTSIEGHITLAHLLISEGKLDRSAQSIEETKQIASKNILTGTGKQYVSLHEAYLQLRQGNLYFAQSWAEKRGLKEYLDFRKLEPSENTGADVIRNFELMLFARILMAENRYKDAFGMLSKLLPAFSQLGHQVKVIETYILTAVTQNVLGLTIGAVESMMAALELAVSADYIRVFVEEGPSAIHLIEQIRSTGDSSSFAQEILTASQAIAAQSKPSMDSPILIENLSDREIEILRLLISELTVPEIAENIHISVSTLRTHIRNIYRKLDTHSRFETVSKAKDLNII